MASEKLSAMTYALVAVGDFVYGISTVRKKFKAEEIAQLILGLASERTKQHNFNATDLVALKADSVTNGDFTTDTGWVKGTGWDVDTTTADKAHCDGTQGADTDLENTGNVAISSTTYEVVFTVSGYSAGNVVAVIGGEEGTDRAADGTFTELITATSTEILKIRGDLNFIGDIDVVTMKSTKVQWDLDDNQVCSITLDQDLEFANPTNMVDGASYVLHVIQDSTGTRDLTWGSAYKWIGSSAPTLTATGDAHDIIHFECDGTYMYGRDTGYYN